MYLDMLSFLNRLKKLKDTFIDIKIEIPKIAGKYIA
jgi:hypothetical protein